MAPAAPVLSLIVPTYNERENLPLLVAAVRAAFCRPGGEPLPVEIIVVDDNSPDLTWQVAEALARTDPDLHLIRRIGRRGLSTAVLEGFASATANLFAVIDADLQHDPRLLPEMVARAQAGADLVVASRYAAGGDVAGWHRGRRLLSMASTVLARLVLRTRTSDPLSGYFLIRRERLAPLLPRLRPRGYKILLEILARGRLACADLPYHFGVRQHGVSKLDAHTQMDAIAELYALSLGRILPLRFLAYCTVGAIGVGVNLGVLWLVRACGAGPRTSLITAIASAMVSNYVLNNLLTFYDQRRTGVRAVLAGMLLFASVCGVGALINYGVADLLTRACRLRLGLADLAGILVATAWNFVLNRTVTWREQVDPVVRT